MIVHVEPFDKDRDLDLYVLGEEDAFVCSFPGITVTHQLRDAFRDSLLRSIESGYWTAFTAIEHVPAGFVLLARAIFSTIPVGYVEAIFVMKEFRGSGVAHALLEFSENHFRKDGIQIVQLDVSKVNESAIKAYTAKGYAVTRYRMEKYLAL